MSLQQARLWSADRSGLLPDVCGAQLLRAGIAAVMRRRAVVRMPAELQPGALRHVCRSLVLRPVRAELRSAVHAKLRSAVHAKLPGSDLPGTVCSELSGSVPAELQRALCSKLPGSLCSFVLCPLMLCTLVSGAELRDALHAGLSGSLLLRPKL